MPVPTKLRNKKRQSLLRGDSQEISGVDDLSRYLV